MKKTLLLLPLVLIAALPLAACGGGSSSSGDSEGAIETAIETAATSTDPSKCTEVQTEAFNEVETGESGKKALQACEEEAKEDNSPAESVKVSNINVDGESATAQVAVGGGALNEQAIEVEVVEEEGDWKLNALEGFANYDGKALGKAIEKRLGEENGAPASLARCMGEAVSGMSQDEAEALAFENNTEGLEKLVEGCQ